MAFARNGQLGLGRLDLFEDAATALEENPPFLGQCHIAGVAMKQPHIQPLLKPHDGFADCRSPIAEAERPSFRPAATKLPVSADCTKAFSAANFSIANR